jgi:hypothetical protein
MRMRLLLAAGLWMLGTAVAYAGAPPTVNLGNIGSQNVVEVFTYGYDTTNNLPRAIAVDATGEIFCNNCSGGGGGGSNAAAGATGSAVPADASYTGFKDGGGNNTGVSASTPFPVTDAAVEAAILSNIMQVNLTNASIAVTGTFWQATQPVSAVSLPLPTGASTSALQTTTNTDLATINTTLGTPMQNSGGTVGLSGTLPSFASQQTVTTTPKVGTLAVGSPALITTGGTAVSVTVANGCYVQNGYTATSQNIAAAESLFANPVTTAVNGSSSIGNSEIQPGTSFNCPPGTTTLSLNAATSAHRYNVVVW